MTFDAYGLSLSLPSFRAYISPNDRNAQVLSNQPRFSSPSVNGQTGCCSQQLSHYSSALVLPSSLPQSSPTLRLSAGDAVSSPLRSLSFRPRPTLPITRLRSSSRSELPWLPSRSTVGYISPHSSFAVAKLTQVYSAGHVIYKDTSIDDGYIPDSQIASSIKVLNADYAPCGVRFFLAGTDRTLNPSWFDEVGPNR